VLPRAAQGLLLASIFLNPYIIYFNYSIMSESLFFTAQIFFLAFFIQYLAAPTLRALALASAGLAVLVRAAGWSLVRLLPILLVLAGGRARLNRTALVAALAIPCAATVAAGSTAKSLRFGSDSRTQAPRILFEKTMLFSAGPSPYPAGSAEDKLRALTEQQGGEVRNFIARVPTLVARTVLDTDYQGYLMTAYQWAMVMPAIADGKRFATEAQGERVVLKVAMKRISTVPAAYLKASLGNALFHWASLNNAMAYDAIVGMTQGQLRFPLVAADSQAFFPVLMTTKPHAFKLIASYVIVGVTALLGVLSVVCVASYAWMRWVRGKDDDLLRWPPTAASRPMATIFCWATSPSP
jgi:hypothetical protein